MSASKMLPEEIEKDFDPSIPQKPPISTLIVGCGNILRGDDAVGPVLIRRMWEKGLPSDVHCADGGTGGMDVAFQMRGVPHVILVDASQSGSEPGSIFELPGEEVEQLPPLSGMNLHAFRWDHALAFGRWLLKKDYPKRITVYLIEGEQFQIGEPLTPAVDRAVDELVGRLIRSLNTTEHRVLIEFTPEGYMRISKEDAVRFFPEDSLVALWREGKLYLLPTRGAAAGGLMLKHRNTRGDRSLLMSEVFRFEIPTGQFHASWNNQFGGLHVEGVQDNPLQSDP